MCDKCINPSNLPATILLLTVDGNAAFGLASNLKPARLGCTCRGYNPHRYSTQGQRGTQASPPRQGSNNRGGYFVYVCVCFLFILLFKKIYFIHFIIHPFVWFFVLAPPFQFLAYLLVIPLWIIIR